MFKSETWVWILVLLLCNDLNWNKFLTLSKNFPLQNADNNSSSVIAVESKEGDASKHPARSDQSTCSAGRVTHTVILICPVEFPLSYLVLLRHAEVALPRYKHSLWPLLTTALDSSERRSFRKHQPCTFGVSIFLQRILVPYIIGPLSSTIF